MFVVLRVYIVPGTCEREQGEVQLRVAVSKIRDKLGSNRRRKIPLGDEGGDGGDEKARKGRKREKSEHTFATRNSIHQNPRPNFRAASDNLYMRPRIRPAFPIPNRDSVRELLPYRAGLHWQNICD